MVVNEMLSLYLKGNPLQGDETSFKEIQQWSLIKRGLRHFSSKEYLVKNSEGHLVSKVPFIKEEVPIDDDEEN